MKEVAGYIAIGTNAYLSRQVKTIGLVVPWLFIAMWLAFGSWTAIAFLSGVALSLIAGYIGMNVAIRSNVRTASAAIVSMGSAFRTAFMGGSVTGLSVTALSLLALCTLRTTLGNLEPLIGFGFGGSLAALFAQIGGGIYTKSADIGADLVGKLEEEIPEDDPRNAAVIADLVGDNVGDCAGRGSDLFQSFSDDMITGMILGAIFSWKYGANGVVFPLVMQATGILGCIVGISLVREWKGRSPSASLFLGLFLASAVNAFGLYILSMTLLNDFTIFIAGLSGLIATLIAVLVSEYYTGLGNRPIRRMAEISQGGAAINIITGFSFGLQSSILPILAVVAAIIISFVISGGSLYAIVVANIGTDLLSAFIMSSDAYGPIADNAEGIARMSGVSAEASASLQKLDAVGNTMKASTKAFAMASGTLTAFVTFLTYFSTAGIPTLAVSVPFALAALYLGVALPYLFSSLTIGATANGALRMVYEVRRQFREMVGLREGKTTPDYARCVDIAAANALKEMVIPGILAFSAPVVMGVLFGPEELGTMLVGAAASAALLGFFFNNVGAAFDNAKKLVETGLYGDRGSIAYKASVVGDTVGDPLKDVAGPSLLIFMKLVGMTALLILRLLH